MIDDILVKKLLSQIVKKDYEENLKKDLEKYTLMNQFLKEWTILFVH